MGTFIILTALVLIGPLALAYGADSRDTYRSSRPWWPGAPRT